MSRHPWWRLGVHKKYHDGNISPACRGWIHALSAAMALPLLGWWTAEPAVPRSLVAMLVLKVLVYAASAAFHLVAWKLPQQERRALIVDVSLIPLGILGGVLPFSDEGGLGFATDFALGAALTLLNVVFVAFQFRHGPSFQPGDSGPRSLVLVGYWLYNEVVAGRVLGFDNWLWQLTPVLYLTAFACANGVDAHRAKVAEPVVLPHHRKGVWSLHEDFHLMLLIADAFCAWIAWQLAFSPQNVLLS